MLRVWVPLFDSNIVSRVTWGIMTFDDDREQISSARSGCRCSPHKGVGLYKTPHDYHSPIYVENKTFRDEIQPALIGIQFFCVWKSQD